MEKERYETATRIINTIQNAEEIIAILHTRKGTEPASFCLHTLFSKDMAAYNPLVDQIAEQCITLIQRECIDKQVLFHRKFRDL